MKKTVFRPQKVLFLAKFSGKGVFINFKNMHMSSLLHCTRVRGAGWSIEADTCNVDLVWISLYNMQMSSMEGDNTKHGFPQPSNRLMCVQ